MHKKYYNAKVILDCALTNDLEYTNLLDIPINQYNHVIFVSDIKLSCDDSESNVQYVLYKLKNLKRIIFDSYSYTWKINDLLSLIVETIANLQKLSCINFDDGEYSFSLKDHNTLSYIADNKMTIIGNRNDVSIPDHIEYLNIIYNDGYDFTNLPSSIKHLHISYDSYDDYVLDNLPILLETLSITLTGYDTNTVDIRILNDSISTYIKLPFNCAFNLDVL